VEAIRTDAVIEVAKADYEFLSRQADDVHQAYDLAVVRAEDAHKQLLELQRHKRDVLALRERLLSLLAGGNISTKQDVERRAVTANDRANYAVRIVNSAFAPAGYKLKPHVYDAIMSGELDHVIAEWLEETWG
jgi:hypothetical protein